MPKSKLSEETQKALNKFAEAAQAWGYEEQHYTSDLVKERARYWEAKEKFEAYLLKLEQACH